ncbi:hypothetical protein AMTRI_Chr04g246060 [Amborella trichopoda]
MALFATVVTLDVSPRFPWSPICVGFVSSCSPLLGALSPLAALNSPTCLLSYEEHLLFVFADMSTICLANVSWFVSRLLRDECVCYPLMAVMNPVYSGLKPLVMIHLIVVSVIQDSRSSLEILWQRDFTFKTY